jgi:ABC-type nickel/cobalt efflux system permease component RcnA
MLASHYVLLAVLAISLHLLFADRVPGPWLEWVGPLATIGFGAYLLWRRQQEVKAARKLGHADACTCQAHDPAVQNPEQGIRQAATMGFFLGLVPCPMAVGTVVLALQAHSLWLTAIIVAGYVLGMGVVLLAIASLVLWGRPLIARGMDAIAKRYKVALDLRLASAWLIIGLGVVYLLANHWHTHQHIG